MEGWRGGTRNREKEAELLEHLEDGENKRGVLGQGRVVDNKWCASEKRSLLVLQVQCFNVLDMSAFISWTW